MLRSQRRGLPGDGDAKVRPPGRSRRPEYEAPWKRRSPTRARLGPYGRLLARQDTTPPISTATFLGCAGPSPPRYKAHVRDGRVKRIQSLQAEVRRATTAHHSKGAYPSYRRVMAMLDKPRQMHEPQAVIAWHQTLQELGWPGSPDTQSAA